VSTRPRRGRGFTLIEVLVALGIVSIALVAGLQATAALTNNAQRQSDALLAHLCAENELARLRLGRQMPGVGESEQPCEQGGQAFRVRVKVSSTPNPSFRRIDAQVWDERTPILKVSTVLGRF
jgi:general secretion pathway protein I